MSGGHSPGLALMLLVALAGALGSVVRFVVVEHVAKRPGGSVAAGIVVVNGAGSLVLGLLVGSSMYHGLGARPLDVAGIGLCGGLTTWSAAAWEAVAWWGRGGRRMAVGSTLLGLALSLGAAAAGIGLAGIT